MTALASTTGTLFSIETASVFRKEQVCRSVIVKRHHVMSHCEAGDQEFITASRCSCRDPFV